MLPQIRMQPWYPGQMGVPGSDVPRGLLSVAGRKVFHVNNLHPNSTDAADGTDPKNPKKTIQSAINSTLLSHGDVIVVGPSTAGSTYAGISTANYSENVVIANTRPAFVTLMASGASKHQVVWDAAVTSSPCLDIRAPGWVVSGFKFHSPATSAAILLRDTSPTALDQTQYTIIEDNYFDGAWAGKYGIEMTGCPGNTVIRRNWFLEHKQGNGTAFAVISTGTGNADPYECILADNLFMENNNHVDVSYNVSSVTGNQFHIGSLIAATIKLDLRGGTIGKNIVTGNIFSGVYTNVGGYYAGTSDFWIGNIAVPNAGTVADNGFTVAVPA